MNILFNTVYLVVKIVFRQSKMQNLYTMRYFYLHIWDFDNKTKADIVGLTNRQKLGSRSKNGDFSILEFYCYANIISKACSNFAYADCLLGKTSLKRNQKYSKMLPFSSVATCPGDPLIHLD